MASHTRPPRRSDRPPRLRGRVRERAALDRLVAGVRAGESAVLVLRGEPGVGKTMLLRYAAGGAAGCRIARAAGVESEMELAFAGLHQLCAPELGRLDALPAPQQAALRTAFGLAAGEPPDRFVVGMAVLGLLDEVAADQPLLCLVDDVQWLDRATSQALAFAARRLQAEPIGMLFAVRVGSVLPELAGLPELVVEGLGDTDARALLASAIRGPLDERVRDRIVAETGGNPLALLELPRGLTPGQLAGGFGLPGIVPLEGRIEQSFRRQLAPLPDATRRLLLIAAAEPAGEPLLLWRAAAKLGVGLDAAAPAEAAGLLRVGGRVGFSHPLVRSAVYRAASGEERRAAHRALAEATDPELDPDRRAWHQAEATDGPDEAVAMELVRSAGRARARGGLAAAAAFLERATELTPDPARRTQRALAAAAAKQQAGAPDAARKLLAIAETGPSDEPQRAQAATLRAQIVALQRGGDAPPLLLEAARRLEPLDARAARETYLEALAAALFAGHLTRGGVAQVASAARAAPPPPGPPRASDLLLDGLALSMTDGPAAGAPTVRRALGAFRGEDVSAEERLRWQWLAASAAIDLWDDASWHALSTQLVQLARDAGALALLPVALTVQAGLHVYAGELAAARPLIDELDAVAEATGISAPPYAALALATLQGRDATVADLIETTMIEVQRRGEGQGVNLIQWARAYAHNAAGRHDEALAAAEEAGDRPLMLYGRWVLVELVEAAALGGRRERATVALRRLAETMTAGGGDFALGMHARLLALLSEGDLAEPLHREAIERLGRTRIRSELARSRLLYGEWLRRQGDRAAAREELRTAHELFTGMGMEAFAGRAAAGVRATGGTAARHKGTTNGLTPQEAQIARLARDGLSNAEIGARLFLSSRTIEYHLGKVFTKVNVRSRLELTGVLPEG